MMLQCLVQKYYLTMQWRRFHYIDFHEYSIKVYLTVLLENQLIALLEYIDLQTKL